MCETQTSCACRCGQNAPVRTVVYHVPAMDCPVEERLVLDALNAVPGVLAVTCDLAARRVSVRHEQPSLPAIEAALGRLGLGARPVGSAERVMPPAQRLPWRRLAVAGLLALLAELLDLLPLWPGASGLKLADWRPAGLPVAALLPPAAALSAILLSGAGIFRKGWQAVLHGQLTMNALMAVAVTGAVAIGQYPEAAMVTVLFNVSEALEGMALERSRASIRRLLATAPATALVCQSDGSWRSVDCRDVPVGSRVRVRPGAKVPLDGRVVAGASAVNQAPITGESLPVDKTVGDMVYAGTVNTSGELEFTVTAAARDTTLARIIHAVEQAQAGRAPMQRFVDAFARWYTPAVFALAVGTALLPPLAWGRGWGASLYTALVVLVIACPCALVISVPVTIVGGLTAAARHGILVKGGLFLELGRKLTCLALDKTGTITCGQPRQTDFVLMGDADADFCARRAASLAARSDHPVSRAIAERYADRPLLAVEGFAAIPGRGICGRMEGELWHLGNGAMMEGLGWGSPDLRKALARLEGEGGSVAALAGPRGVAALLAVADTLRESSLEALGELKRLGVRTVMLSGDTAAAARSMARRAGVDAAHGGLLPSDKQRVVESLESRGDTVGMVGDGVNDAPALASAHIGFAMAGNGTDTAIETADVALMDDDLRKIPRFIRLSRDTCAIVRQNIALALGIKALCFGLTFAGWASMWMAVFADVGTTLLVVANGLRASRL